MRLHVETPIARLWPRPIGVGWFLGAGAADDPAASLLLPGPVSIAIHGIDAQRIRAHVKFLADDLLEGRGTGTRGGDMAANYIAAQFALDGLKPAGDNGSYLQNVDFTGVLTQPATTMSVMPARRRAARPEARRGLRDQQPNRRPRGVEVDAPIVFVGYGIDAPEYRWNDFQGVDVKGQGRAPDREPAALAGPGILHGRCPDVLRPLDLQSRGGGAPGRGGGAHHPSHGSRELWLAGRPEFLEQRAGVPARRARSETRGGLLDRAGRGTPAVRIVRTQAR